MFNPEWDGIDEDRWHDDGGPVVEDDEPLHEDEDDEPANIDDDAGYDPYAGAYDYEFYDCISDDGPFSDFGSDF